MWRRQAALFFKGVFKQGGIASAHCCSRTADLLSDFSQKNAASGLDKATELTYYESHSWR
jgi:hypothetical protein